MLLNPIREAIASCLAQLERRTFQGEILRAAQARVASEATAIAAEALCTDNEALELAESETRVRVDF